jgi:hypothetical protein
MCRTIIVNKSEPPPLNEHLHNFVWVWGVRCTTKLSAHYKHYGYWQLIHIGTHKFRVTVVYYSNYSKQSITCWGDSVMLSVFGYVSMMVTHVDGHTLSHMCMYDHHTCVCVVTWSHMCMCERRMLRTNTIVHVSTELLVSCQWFLWMLLALFQMPASTDP